MHDLRRTIPYERIASGFELDADLSRFTAGDVDSADARDCLQPRRHHFVGEARELAHGRSAALHRDRNDRTIVRIEVVDDRLFDLRRKRAADARNLCLHVLLRREHVDVEIELQSNERDAVQATSS